MSNGKKKDRIYLEFSELFDEVKKRSELKSRSMSDEVIDRYIITDSRKDVIKIFYEDAVAEVSNDLGAFGQLKDHGGTAIYTLSEKQTEQGMKQTKRLLVRVFVNYMLYEWFKEVGQSNIAGEYLQFYKESVEKYRTNSTRTNFVKPKYRPYF